MEKPGDCLATHIQNLTSLWRAGASRWAPSQLPAAQLFHRFILWTPSGTLEARQRGFHYWVLHCGFLPLTICGLMFWFLKWHISLSSGWDKILCEIQTRLITRLIKFRTFRPSCKIKSMPVAAFHNLFTSWLCDAIKMLHLQVILLAFTFMPWLTGLARKALTYYLWYNQVD